MVWYSHLLSNFPQSVVIHTVKGFSVLNETEVDIFYGIPCFLYDPTNVGNLIMVPLSLKVLQAILQQYVNQVFPDGQAGFRKGRGTRGQIANIH